MTINNTINFFENLLKKTDKKSEIKIYKDFITILSNLKNRELTDEQVQSIEKELDSLKLKSNTNNKKRYLGKKLNEFKTYLNDEFSLISEGYYTAIGMSLGMCFGVAIGTSLGASGTSIGLALGMLIGLLIGRSKDEDAKKQNRVLKTKLK